MDPSVENELLKAVANAINIDVDDDRTAIACRRCVQAAFASLTSEQRDRRIAKELKLAQESPHVRIISNTIQTILDYEAVTPDDAGAAEAYEMNIEAAHFYDDQLARAGLRDEDKGNIVESGRSQNSERNNFEAGTMLDTQIRDGAGPSRSGKLPVRWLRNRCAQTLSNGGDADISDVELTASVLSLLLENRTNDELQELLFDALRYDFEAVSQVLENRLEIASQAEAILADCASQSGSSTSGNTRRRRRGPRLESDLDDGPPLPGLGGSAVDEMQRAFPGLVLDSNRAIGEVDRVGLPKGSERFVGDGYEEIFIPPAPPKSNVKLGKLIDVSDAFESYTEFLEAMQGVTTFNRLQSAVFPIAYKSNENMLVCAPTGAGKTNVALLTVFQQIVALKNGSQKDFKIVYVAPMKALAAEVVEKFGKKLSPLGLKVREYTGDMNLTRREAAETHVLVTTPEKWDVVTRKSASSLSSSITLLILDEVHLLHDDRGSVLESIIARTLRLSESSQKPIRLVGLSATLPNYEDVASFLRVDPNKGLFHFDAGHRPVPLSQTFIGISAGGQGTSYESRRKKENKMMELTWTKVKDSLSRGHQAMIFVHSRKQTAGTARELVAEAMKDEVSDIFLGGIMKSEQGSSSSMPRFGDGGKSDSVLPTWALREISKSRSSDVRELCPKGVGIHHAGMQRPDRKLVERLFAEGVIRVLCCTATLAWGVNLPARTVVIKGTEVYNAEKGRFEQLGMLDVMQIFGRAGRPQFDTEGEGIIITKHENLSKYLNLLTASVPIESTLGVSASKLADHLNAEIVSGTVSSIGEGVKWLSYTFLSVRMPKNPLVYGLDWAEVAADPELHSRRATLVEQAANALDDAKMCRFDPRTGSLASTDLGRVCSHSYVSHRTVVLWNELLCDVNPYGDTGGSERNVEQLYSLVLEAVALASEFEQMRSRQDETKELEYLMRTSCPIPMRSTSETREGKVSILLQAHISRAQVRMSDLSYVVQSCTRLLRAFFEITLRRGLQGIASAALELARSSECQIWPFQHPLLQFSYHSKRGTGFVLPAEVIVNVKERGPGGSLRTLKKLDHEGLFDIIRAPKMIQVLKRTVNAVPILAISHAFVGPLTRSLLRFRVLLRPDFKWNDSVHGKSESWWFWIEDRKEMRIYYSEKITLNKMQVQKFVESDSDSEESNMGHSVPSQQKGILLDILVPVFDPPSPKYWIRVDSEYWHTDGGSTKVLNLSSMLLPQRDPPKTQLMDLSPLPVQRVLPSNVADPLLSKFTHLNPIQSQLFHTLYNSDCNLFAAVPLGSGKTALAEFAMFRAIKLFPHKCVVYLVPSSELARKRSLSWEEGLSSTVFSRVINLPQRSALFNNSKPHFKLSGSLVVATPSSWNTLARDWTPKYFKNTISTVILDELHLIDGPDGHELEAVISRMRMLAEHKENDSAHMNSNVRMVGLSAPVANPMEIADWLAADPLSSVFNFSPSARTVPCATHLFGVAEEQYAHRMQSMTKLIYSSIQKFSLRRGTLVFTSSMKQAKLTAQDLLRFAELDGKPYLFVGETTGPTSELSVASQHFRDPTIRDFVSRGIGLWHSGMSRRDRDAIELLFSEGHLTVVATSFDAAWESKLRASLVIVKGTEKYHPGQERFIDLTASDILQMIGRSGRPQLDTQCHSVILVHERKKPLVKKVLYEPLPVESLLQPHFSAHLLEEVATERVQSPQQAMDFMSWTYLFRRVFMNPSYYGIRSSRGPKNAEQNPITSLDYENHYAELISQSLKKLWLYGMLKAQNQKSLSSSNNIAAETRIKVRVQFEDQGRMCFKLSELGWTCVRSGISCRSVYKLKYLINETMTIANLIDAICQCAANEGVGMDLNDSLIEHIMRSMPMWYLSATGKEERNDALDKLGLMGRSGSLLGRLKSVLHGHLSGVLSVTSDSRSLLKDTLTSITKCSHAALAVAIESKFMATSEQLIVLIQAIEHGYLPSAPIWSLAGLDNRDDLKKCVSVLKQYGIEKVEEFMLNKKKSMDHVVKSGVRKAVSSQLERFVNSIPEVSIDKGVVEEQDGSRYIRVMAKAIWSSEIGRRIRGHSAYGSPQWFMLVSDVSGRFIFAARPVEQLDSVRYQPIVAKLSGKVDTTNLKIKFCGWHGSTEMNI